MIVYLFVFSISIFFAFLAERRRKNDMIYFLYLIVIVFLNSFIAGARNDNIGTDTVSYTHLTLPTIA